MTRQIPLALLAAFALNAAGLRAQARTGAITGSVYDSVRRTPLAGATISARGDQSPRAPAWRIVTDSRGRFELESLPAGAYLLSIAHPWLDSARMNLPEAAVMVQSGRRERVRLAIPSPRTLRQLMCGDGDTESGVVTGIVLSANTGAPIDGAAVVFRWIEVDLNPTTLDAASRQVSVQVTSGGDGTFRSCQLPLDRDVLVEVRHGSEQRSGVVDARLSANGVSVETILVGDTRRSEGYLVRGLVSRAQGGSPLGNARVRLEGTDTSAITSADGTFELRGVPAGSRMLEVAAIGYRPARARVDVVPPDGAVTTVELRRLPPLLDTVRTTGQRRILRSAHLDFESRRRRGLGRFITREDLERRKPLQASDMLRLVQGIRIVGQGSDAQIRAARGLKSCISVYLDGALLRTTEANLVPPAQLYGIEVYAPASAPAMYARAGCGVVLFWTR